MNTKIFSLLTAFFMLLSVYSQTTNPLLTSVINKMKKVNDYSANVTIKADVPMIKVQAVNAKIYFKKENKFKVKSKSIAILPKQGFTEVNSFLFNPKKYISVETGSQMIGNKSTKIITVIPNENTNNIVLAKLWIDPINKLILESEVTTRKSGTLKAKYSYGANKNFGLPASILFTVDVKDFKMPKSFSSNPHRGSSKKTKTKKQGKILLNISNYQINKGIPDSFFKK